MNHSKMRSFRIGGIHPPANKLSAGRPIVTIAPGGTVVIPLDQHIGTPALAAVVKGDKVKAGTLVGRAGGAVSANVHSPVSGTVMKVDTLVDGFGRPRPAIYINVEGDEWETDIDRSERLVKECRLPAEEIIRKIDAAGVVGMGGAAFPTRIKLLPPPGSHVEMLIVNAVECEPYLTADYSLMMAKSEEMMTGIAIVMKALKVGRAVVGIESNKPDAIERLSGLASQYSGIEVMPLKMKYPQGGEKQLIDAVIRRRVKSGALPVSAGVVVHNAGTVFAVYEAVQKNKPLIERVVTVTGRSIARPSDFRVRIGTPVSVLVDAAGGMPAHTGKIISGGPMMGRAMIDADMPVMKGTSGILMLTAEETRRRPAHDCIRCAKCTAACPMGLEPSLLMNLSEYKLWEDAEKNYVVDCIECGSCSYTCPANRPLLDYIRLGKNRVTGIIRERKN